MSKRFAIHPGEVLPPVPTSYLNHRYSRRDLLRMAAGAAFLSAVPSVARGTTFFVYWGTYTEGGGQFGNGDSKGIYVSRMDAGTGKLTQPELAAESANPSWMTIHPSRRYLYAVNEHVETGAPGENASHGELSAFSIDHKTGKLTPAGDP